MKWRFLFAVGLLCLATLNGASAAPITQTFDLDQSNTFADGTVYGTVEITADTATGTVDFVVDAFVVAAYGGAGSNFGIQSFGFNTSLAQSDITISLLPAGWSSSTTANQDGFGEFTNVESGTGSNRQDPLTFRVTTTNPADALIANFYVLSSDTAGQGNVQFAAHVAGFNNQPGSHFIGGGPPHEDVPPPVVPEPSSLLLLGVGLSGMAAYRRLSRKAAA